MGDILNNFSISLDSTSLNAFIRSERYICELLENRGHTILAQNYFVHNVGEVDIISMKDGVLYATEVKARKTHDQFGGAKAQFTIEKQSRVIKALQHYASYQNQHDIQVKLLYAAIKWDDQQVIVDCELLDWDLY